MEEKTAIASGSAGKFGAMGIDARIMKSATFDGPWVIKRQHQI